FFSSRRRHTSSKRDWSSDVCSSDLHEGDPAYKGMEIQLLDDDAEQYAELEPWQYTGSIYDVKAPSQRASKEAGQWQKMGITLDRSEERRVGNEDNKKWKRGEQNREI